MSSFVLRPPLPEGLSHSDIEFILPSEATLSAAAVAAIAAALQELLPLGDFTVGADGAFGGPQNKQSDSLWFQVGLYEGIERGIR
jgi:hypothetical protein